MLKLGVLRPDQFFPSPPDRLLAYLFYRISRSRFSLRLLQADEAIFEALMPHVRLSNNVRRATFRQRFRNLDPIVNQIIARSFPARDELVVEDWAASTCLTSCEWAESLLPLFPRLRFVASDRELCLVEVEHKSSGDLFFAERDGELLQYVRSPFVIRMAPPEPWLLPINRLCYYRARRSWRDVLPLWPLPESWLDDPCGRESLERNDYIFRKLPLIHPRALQMALDGGYVKIRRHSVFDNAPEPCHVIRSMNILNLAYFTEKEVEQGVRSVMGSLHPLGIWIIGRTIQDDPPEHTATILRKRCSGDWEILERIGGGSEIETIALRVNQKG